MDCMLKEVNPYRRGRQHSLKLQQMEVYLVLTTIQDLQANKAPRPRNLASKYAQLGLQSVLKTPYLVRAIDTVRELLRIKRDTLQDVMTLFLSGQPLQEPDTSGRGKGSPKWTPSLKFLTPPHLARIKSFIEQRLADRRVTTTPHIQDMLATEFLIQVPPYSVRYALHTRLKFPFGKIVAIGSVDLTVPVHINHMRRFTSAYNQALLDPKAVLVYSDETYVNTSHHNRFGWFPPGYKGMKIPSGKGPRLIIIHAITYEDGLLTTNGPDGKHLDPDYLWRQTDEEGNKKKKTRKKRTKQEQTLKKYAVEQGEVRTAELIYQAGEHQGNYHKNMDGDGYCTWVLNRLLPAFRAKHKDKQGRVKAMRLVVDGAGYHSKHNPKWSACRSCSARSFGRNGMVWW